MLSRTTLLALPCALAGCGSAAGGPAEPPPGREPRAVAPDRPSAPAAAGTLAAVAAGPAAARRLAFADLRALERADLPVPARAVVRRVLLQRAGAARRSGAPRAALVGRRRLVLPRAGAPAPPRSAITAPAQSAVQSCLGETLAQTLLGPRTMGHDAALGVALARSGDPPAGIQLRVCGAPRLVRHLHATGRRLRRAFAGARARIEDREIGERGVVAATVAAADVPRDRLLALIGGGPALRRLAWR